MGLRRPPNVYQLVLYILFSFLLHECGTIDLCTPVKAVRAFMHSWQRAAGTPLARGNGWLGEEGSKAML